MAIFRRTRPATAFDGCEGCRNRDRLIRRLSDEVDRLNKERLRPRSLSLVVSNVTESDRKLVPVQRDGILNARD